MSDAGEVPTEEPRPPQTEHEDDREIRLLFGKMREVMATLR